MEIVIGSEIGLGIEFGGQIALALYGTADSLDLNGLKG
jgi:hypothetical protein